MKEYPSIEILKPNGEPMYFFDKLDGQNIRIEWTKKRGYIKYGSRHQLCSKTDPIFGPAFHLFDEVLAGKIEDIIRWKKWEDPVTIFCEYWGKKSLGGLHDPEDTMYISLIDINIHKRGFIAPGEFVKLIEKFDENEIATFIGRYNLTKEFHELVYRREIPEITFEGVVGKKQDRNLTYRTKIKTDDWKNAIRQRFQENEAAKLLDS